MDAFIPVGILLVCIAGVVALIALAYLFVVLSKTIKEVMFKVNPLIDDAQEMVSDVRPVIKKVDPMMDRITLTIDAANLEIMRVDQILEDVNNITGNVSKATNSFDSVTQAPLNAIGKVARKVRQVVSPAAAADDGSCVSNVARAVDKGMNDITDRVDAAQEANKAKAEVAAEQSAKRDTAKERANDTAANLKDGIYAYANEDSLGK